MLFSIIEYYYYGYHPVVFIIAVCFYGLQLKKKKLNSFLLLPRFIFKLII